MIRPSDYTETIARLRADSFAVRVPHGVAERLVRIAMSGGDPWAAYSPTQGNLLSDLDALRLSLAEERRLFAAGPPRAHPLA